MALDLVGGLADMYLGIGNLKMVAIMDSSKSGRFVQVVK